jgi:hypothetical protein
MYIFRMVLYGLELLLNKFIPVFLFNGHGMLTSNVFLVTIIT